jgi:hypothetical protein
MADSLTICQMLKSAPSDAGTLYFARCLMGRPYVAHTLEVNDDERLVVNTRQLDCTTLVETVAALTLCAQSEKRSWNDYTDMLTRLRYRQGTIDGYASRLHYFSDWIADKERMGLVGELQQPNPPFSAVQTVNVNYMSRHPHAYKALKANPALVKTIRRQEQHLSGTKASYIPKKSLRDNDHLLRQTIQDGDIIAITTSKPGLDIAHLGFAFWMDDGLHLLNASQLHKKVVVEPMTFYQYMLKHPTFTGIRVVRLKNLKSRKTEKYKTSDI